MEKILREQSFGLITLTRIYDEQEQGGTEENTKPQNIHTVWKQKELWDASGYSQGLW